MPRDYSSNRYRDDYRRDSGGREGHHHHSRSRHEYGDYRLRNEGGHRRDDEDREHWRGDRHDDNRRDYGRWERADNREDHRRNDNREYSDDRSDDEEDYDRRRNRGGREHRDYHNEAGYNRQQRDHYRNHQDRSDSHDYGRRCDDDDDQRRRYLEFRRENRDEAGRNRDQIHQRNDRNRGNEARSDNHYDYHPRRHEDNERYGMGHNRMLSQGGRQETQGRPPDQFAAGIASEVGERIARVCCEYNARDLDEIRAQGETQFEMSVRPRQQSNFGRPRTLLINYFGLERFEPFKVYQFDVEISESRTGSIRNDPGNPQSLSSLKQRTVIEGAISNLGIAIEDQIGIIYDGGRIVYTTKRLPRLGEVELSSGLKAKFNRVSELIIKQSIDSSSREEVQMIADHRAKLAVMDTALKCALRSRFTAFGRSFFDLNIPPVLNVGPAMGLYKGIFSSTVISKDKLALNVDVANTVIMPEMKLSEYLTKMKFTHHDWTSHSTNENTLARMREVMKKHRKLIIYYNPAQKRYFNFHSFQLQTVVDVTFAIGNEANNGAAKEMSVAEYFHSKYNISCNKTDITVRCGPDGQQILPFELLSIAASKIPNEDIQSEMSNIIRKTALRPDTRRSEIDSKIASIHSPSRDFCHEMMAEWRLEFKTDMMKVSGKLLDLPKLYHRSGRINYTRPSGTWTPDSRFKYFRMPTMNKPLTWSYYSFTRDARDVDTLEEFLKTLTGRASQMGIPFERSGTQLTWNSRTFFAEFVHHFVGRNAADVTFFYVNPTGGQYPVVKSLCELASGSTTQFLTRKSLFKKQNSQGKFDPKVIENLCHKLCAKVGGINVSLTENPWTDEFDPSQGKFGSTMFMGLDVTHKAFVSGNRTSRVSVVAVVGSLDPVPHQYTTEICLQKNPRGSRASVEIVYNMQAIAKNLLKAYHASNNNHYPDRIIVYRDGVSDGQLKLASRYEVKAIINACNELGIPDTRVAVIIVQKRHHVRMFTDVRDESDRSGNPLPGTVYIEPSPLDSAIDAFLISHAGIQGTSRPTRYRLIYDSIGLSQKEVLEMTYGLCHLYARCFRTVSVPAPCYYAHHVAFRARYYVDLLQKCDPEIKEYLYEDAYDESANTSFVKNRRTTTATYMKFLSVKLSDKLKGKLFFC